MDSYNSHVSRALQSTEENHVVFFFKFLLISCIIRAFGVSIFEPIKQSWQCGLMQHVKIICVKPTSKDFVTISTPIFIERANEINI
jgi:hypothetical protein